MKYLFYKSLFFVLIFIMFISCATVRQQDLDSWVGMPVEALDLHSIFITIPMYRTITDSGVEIRNYVNGKDVFSCFGSTSSRKSGKYVNSTTFSNCSSSKIVCNNIFYIKEGKVLEYAPTGRCYTDERAQPESRYLDLINK